MNNFSAVRIDDRLIHGQIVATWISALAIKSIIVADTKASEDSLQKMLLRMAVPASIDFEIMTFEDAAAAIKSGDDMSRTLLIVRNIEGLKKLMELGAEFGTVNFGNCGNAAGRVQYFKSVWLTPDERAVAESVMDAGVKLEVRVVPTEKALDLRALLK